MAGGSREGPLPRALAPQPGDHISGLFPGFPCDLGLQSHKNLGDGVGPGGGVVLSSPQGSAPNFWGAVVQS